MSRSTKSKPPCSIAVELLKQACAEFRKEPLARAELWIYLYLVIDGTSNGWDQIPEDDEIAENCNLTSKTVKAALRTLTDRGLIQFNGLVPSKEEIHKRAIDKFNVVDMDTAKATGYKPVTYGYRDHERHLFNALLVQNFGAPVVVVKYSLNEEEVMELWRHESQLARYSQAEEVALGCVLKLGGRR